MENVIGILTESYNKAVLEAFNNEKPLLDNKEKITAEKVEQALNEYLDIYQTEKGNIENLWANTPVLELQGRTPSDIINGMDSIDDVYDAFLYMSENTDGEIPDLLINKMKQYGAGMSEKLINLAKASSDTDEHEHTFAETVYTIGRMGLSVSVEPLIHLLHDFYGDENKSEYLEEALKDIGEVAIEPILAELEKDEFSEFEYKLLYVLAYVGSESKDERIYQMLRRAFRKAEEKLPVVVSLAAYKDGRAVPMLRNYLEKNGMNIQKQLFHITLDTVHMLGGDIKELMGMLRDRDF